MKHKRRPELGFGIVWELRACNRASVWWHAALQQGAKGTMWTVEQKSDHSHVLLRNLELVKE